MVLHNHKFKLLLLWQSEADAEDPKKEIASEALSKSL